MLSVFITPTLSNNIKKLLVKSRLSQAKNKINFAFLTGLQTEGTDLGISKFARSLWLADINNQFEADKKRIILLPKMRMLHSYPHSYPPMFVDL